MVVTQTHFAEWVAAATTLEILPRSPYSRMGVLALSVRSAKAECARLVTVVRRRVLSLAKNAHQALERVRMLMGPIVEASLAVQLCMVG